MDSFRGKDSAGVRSIRFLEVFCAHLAELEADGTKIVRFSDFQPNPLYESLVKGVALFRAEGCGGNLAVGAGNSAGRRSGV